MKKRTGSVLGKPTNVYNHMDSIKFGENPKGKSLTTPRQGLTIRQVMERGLNAPPIAKRVEYDGKNPNFNDFDPTSKLGFDRLDFMEVAPVIQERISDAKEAQRLKDEEAKKLAIEPIKTDNQKLNDNLKAE